MKPYSLPRTGKPPLSFEGEITAEALGNPERERWHELRLYETKGGKLVLEILYRSTYVHRKGGKHDQEPSHSWVTVHASLETVPPALAAHAETLEEFIVGYPPWADPTGKFQRAIFRKLRGEWRELTSIILDQAGLVEEVE